MARARPLQCPFCDNYLAGPVEINIGAMDFTGGICICGAIYVLDRTAHNLGEIFMDALTFVCKGNIDKALSMNPEAYESADYDYDIHSNTIGRRSSAGKAGKLVFVRLINDKNTEG
ncbi:MAG TPA: hypothetical protein ENH52_12065 [Nitrospirae bacterium]|nr:hypothetical protein [Nitrospirota bacterium]